MLITGRPEQFKLLANFCSNVAVAWFIVAFVAPVDLLTTLRSAVNIILLLYISLWLLERYHER